MVSSGMLCFGYASAFGTWLLLPFLILFVISYGGIIAQRPPLVREYFGRTNFGAIYGLIMATQMLGNVTGPPLAGWVYDTWGSYQGIWFVFSGLTIVSLIPILTIPSARETAKRVELA